jgi:protein transport protein DSL1/ZW10
VQCVLELKGKSDNKIDSLLADLEKVVLFLSKKLPHELLDSFCAIMMEDLIPKLLHVWLDSAIPVSLKDIGQFQEVIESTKKFCTVLEQNGLSGYNDLEDWVDNAPARWLAKCRETALDSVRTKLAGGKLSFSHLATVGRR